MGIQLLTPNKVSSDRRDEQLDSQRRTIGLAAVEARIVESLNLTRQAVEEAEAELAANLDKVESAAKKRKLEINNEIDALTKKRNLLAESIDRDRKDVDERMVAVAKREENLEKNEAILAEGNRKLQADAEALKKREENVSQREDVVKRVETENNAKSVELAKAQAKLDTDRKRHQSIVTADNERLSGIAARNTIEREQNEKEREELDKRQAALDEKEALVHRYYEAFVPEKIRRERLQNSN